MNNCLVKKLKGTVDNNNLPYRRAFILNVYKSGSSEQNLYSINLGAYPGTKIITDDAHVFYIDGSSTGVNEYTVPNTGSSITYFDLKAENDDYIIQVLEGITNLRALMKVSGDNSNATHYIGWDLGQFNNSVINNVDYRSKYITNTLKSLVLNAWTINFAYCGIDCNIEQLSYSGQQIHTLTLSHSQKVTGSINSDSFATILSGINNDFTLGLENTNVDGSLDTFAANLVAKGKTANKIFVSCAGSNITNARNGVTITFSPSGYVIS